MGSVSSFAGTNNNVNMVNEPEQDFDRNDTLPESNYIKFIILLVEMEPHDCNRSKLKKELNYACQSLDNLKQKITEINNFNNNNNNNEATTHVLLSKSDDIIKSANNFMKNFHVSKKEGFKKEKEDLDDKSDIDEDRNNAYTYDRKDQNRTKSKSKNSSYNEKRNYENDKSTVKNTRLSIDYKKGNSSRSLPDEDQVRQDEDNSKNCSSIDGEADRKVLKMKKSGNNYEREIPLTFENLGEKNNRGSSKGRSNGYKIKEARDDIDKNKTTSQRKLVYAKYISDGTKTEDLRRDNKEESRREQEKYEKLIYSNGILDRTNKDLVMQMKRLENELEYLKK